uniref:Uncharacterized protein n=1 Tax=Pseudonaja textilis TaxID=8673 RepID=A0A670Y0D5_PSETE
MRAAELFLVSRWQQKDKVLYCTCSPNPTMYKKTNLCSFLCQPPGSPSITKWVGAFL